MTQPLTLATDGQDGEPTLMPWSAEAFADACRFIIQNHEGHEAHRHLDRITTELLLSLGYGEGIGIFCRAVQDWHHPQLSYPLPQRPRLFCRLGWHKWVSDRESDYPWVSPEICPHCGARRSSNPCP